MSYTPRRSHRGPQVNYHQVPGAQRQGPGQGVQTRNQSFSTNNQGSNFNLQQQQPYHSYSSAKTFAPSQQQQQPNPVQQQQQPTPVQQTQVQQQQPVQTQQQQAPPPPPPVQVQQPQAVTPAKIVPKVEPATPLPTAETNNEADENSVSETNGSENVKKRFWKKGPVKKISRKIKRRRQNAKLRKMLAPKNALMILNELYQGVKFSVLEQSNLPLNHVLYTVTVEVEGKQYTGHSAIKSHAKQMACENALKSIVLERMVKSADSGDNAGEETMEVNEIQSDTSPAVDADNGNETNKDADGDDSMTGVNNKPKKPILEDDMPWGSLASFALHKLFTEWQNPGAQVSVINPQTRFAPVSSKKVKSQAAVSDNVEQASNNTLPMKKIPEDANQRNPVMLLNQLKPVCQYTEQRDGISPNISFTFTVKVDGIESVGVAKNKRDAKRAAAKAALIRLGVINEDN